MSARPTPPATVITTAPRAAANSGTSTLRRAAIQTALTFLACVGLGSLFMLLAKRAPHQVWLELISATLGDPYQLEQVLYRATTLTFTGLAVAIALDARWFNIGVEGQMQAGLLAAAVVGASLPQATPPWLAIPACLAAGGFAGASIAAAIAWLRIARGAHEVIVSIVTNLLIASISLWLTNAYLFTPGATRTAPIIGPATLPHLSASGSAANWMTVGACLLLVAHYLIRHRTTLGLQLRLVGDQPLVASYLGYAPARYGGAAMLLAGAAAGLASGNLVLGHHYAYEEGLGRGFGFMGVAVALIGRRHPVGIALAALLVAMLSVGGLNVAHLVPKELTELLVGAVVIVVAIAARGGAAAAGQAARSSA